MPAAVAATGGRSKVIHVSGINRAPIRGSFLVSIYGTAGGKRVLLDTEAVLSRWSVQYCANCQTHLEVKAFASVPGATAAQFSSGSFEVELCTRDGVLTDRGAAPAGLAATAAPAKRLYRLEVR